MTGIGENATEATHYNIEPAESHDDRLYSASMSRKGRALRTVHVQRRRFVVGHEAM
jgi:hypothetical protein